MKKALTFFIFLAQTLFLQAATLTDPVVDFGAITYTSSTPSTWTFTVTGGNSYTMSSSGSGATWSGGSYSPLNVTNLEKYTGQSKYGHVRVNSQSPDSHTDSCGTIAITNIDVKPSIHAGVHANFDKKNAKPPVLRNYEDGNIYFSLTGTVTPSANNTGTCTITKTYSNFVGFAEGSSSEPTSGYQYVNMTFSVTIVMPEISTLSHDSGAYLDFGTLCYSGQAQTITVAPNGTITSSNVLCAPNAVSADSFTFHSTAVSTAAVSVPASSITLSNGGNGTLTVNNFQSSCTGSCALVNNDLTFTVGGTLSVPAGAPIGDYTGSYQVTVTY